MPTGEAGARPVSMACMSIHLASVIACLRVLGSEVRSIGLALPGERDRDAQARQDGGPREAGPAFVHRLSEQDAGWRGWVRAVLSRVFDAVRGVRSPRPAPEPSVDVVTASSGLRLVAARWPAGLGSRRRDPRRMAG